MTLTALDRDLWVKAAPLSFVGLQVGTRMTVLRLPSGDLLVHSPCPLDDALRGELNDLGPVRHVIAPNLYHHLYAGEYTAAWPEARLHAPARLATKRADLTVHATLGDAPDPSWGDVIEPLSIDGTLLHETALLHRPTRTLISADVVENFAGCDHWPTRVYLKASGLYGRPGVSRLMRFIYRDRAATRTSIDRVLTRGFDRIIVAHGDVIEREGPEILRASYRWL